ncbi:hypothetical protein F2Q68_00002300 [Brassica cretica]|uniref:Uncharacterized protein n=1 Tax=Brassica cretica TaxID=69181 RepID=A0A8S9JFR1_BRACR|nr:hypothetical protein F2Q68_00002300 [Brassica cretica]
MLESVSPVNTQAKPPLLEFLFYAAAVLQVTIGVEICGCIRPVNTQAKPASLEFLFYAAAVLQVTIGVEICGCIRYLVARDKFFFFCFGGD